MAPVERMAVVAPLMVAPAPLVTLGERRSDACVSSSASPILNCKIQARTGLVYFASRKSKTRSLSVISNLGGHCQEANVPSCKNFGEQASKLSSTLVALAATTLVVATCVTEANAVESLGFEAGAVFERTCAGCHSGGGNILQPTLGASRGKAIGYIGLTRSCVGSSMAIAELAATLSTEDLKKNGVSAVDDIYNVTYFGKNRMPGYGEKCTPRGQCTFGPRLSEEDIRALAEFVRLKADQNWAK